MKAYAIETNPAIITDAYAADGYVAMDGFFDLPTIARPQCQHGPLHR